jgi:hypothetical protein
MAGPQKLTEEQRLRLIELRRMCDAVLDRLADRLPPDVLKQLRTFSAVGEWSELADNLAAVLVRRKIPMTVGDKEALSDLLYWFRQPSPANRYIASRDEVLASLAMVEPGDPEDLAK